MKTCSWFGKAQWRFALSAAKWSGVIGMLCGLQSLADPGPPIWAKIVLVPVIGAVTAIIVFLISVSMALIERTRELIYDWRHRLRIRRQIQALKCGQIVQVYVSSSTDAGVIDQILAYLRLAGAEASIEQESLMPETFSHLSYLSLIVTIHTETHKAFDLKELRLKVRMYDPRRRRWKGPFSAFEASEDVNRRGFGERLASFAAEKIFVAMKTRPRPLIVEAETYRTLKGAV